TGGGVSNTIARSGAPTLAYFNGSLFAAWQDSASGHLAIYAARYDGTAWTPAGSRAMTGAGISSVDGEATQPRLAAGGGRLYLLWAHNRFYNNAGVTSALYARRWDGAKFGEELPGEAARRGISDTGVGSL